jgi:hypothetical protein
VDGLQRHQWCHCGGRDNQQKGSHPE